MAKGKRRTPSAGSLPSKDEIVEFLKTSQGKVGNREIARAFGIKGGDRVGMKRLLAKMADEGLLTGNRKQLRRGGHLPSVAVLEIITRDTDGDLVAEPAVWDGDGARPRVLVLERRKSFARGEVALGVGDRVLARIIELDSEDVAGYAHEAEPIKRLPRERRRLVGIFRSRAGGGGVIDPVDRKELKEWPIGAGDEGGARDGDLVRFDLARSGRFGVPTARVAAVIGNPQDQRQISLIAVHAHGIPDAFPDSVLAEVKRLEPPRAEGRLDLRPVPLVTIDPVDARDHDDAVHAVPDADPKNRGGHIVTVAIADVAHYVRPGSGLDREARLRGNSCYFPDRVVAMLPERISNDLCSLREGEDRPCLAVRMVIDASGRKRRHTFHRALMRSAAKLSYDEAQAAIEGKPSRKCEPLMEAALRPLWAAYAVLARARDDREPLNLDLPERKILLDTEGRVARVVIPQRLEAHRLIEEMMIQANVATAETLEQLHSPCVYRVHGGPTKEKLAALRDFLASLDLKLPGSGALKPAHFNRVLAQARRLPVADLVNEVVLRSQAQAEYAPDNVGHFGLNLARYAHFTSPIRRYADLVVHRALIRALKLGAGGLIDDEAARLEDTCTLISQAERRAMAAERETADRLIAAHLADRVGAEFDGRIAGVTRVGLFVKLADTGADGFVPAAHLGQEYFRYEERLHSLVGDRSGETYRLGDEVRVRLIEAIPSAGALRFEMLSHGKRHGIALPKAIRARRRTRGRQKP